eukprot:266288-Ditylum_brightwellii.AAC.1
MQWVEEDLTAPLNELQIKQANATQEIAEAYHQLLDYVTAHPDATVCFLASDMILTIHSNTSYLSESKARSRAAKYYYLANKNNKDFNNGAVLTLSTIIRHVVALASEAELAALFYNAQEA